MKELLSKLTEALISLLKVKTIITIATAGLFVYLSIKGQMPKETIALVIGMVFTYYFNKDKNKGGE